jgi:hypothetical protein
MRRCADCGFLAARISTTRELVEVEAGLRKRWGTPADLKHQRANSPYAEVPECFVGAANLADEAAIPGRKGSVPPEQVDKVIHKDRGTCPGFFQWRPGRSPGEHLTLHDMLESQKTQAEIRERDRQWQEEQRERDRQEKRESDRRNQRWQVFTVILGAVLALVNGVVLYLIFPKPSTQPIVIQMPAEKAAPAGKGDSPATQP